MKIRDYCEKHSLSERTVLTVLSFAKVDYDEDENYFEDSITESYLTSCDLLLSDLDVYTISAVSRIVNVSVSTIENYLSLMGYVTKDGASFIPSEKGIKANYFISDRDLIFTPTGFQRINESFGDKAIEETAEKWLGAEDKEAE